MDESMITLEQYYSLYEKKISEKQFREETKNITNIRCEKCDKGLYIADDVTNMSLPPTKWVVCDRCGDRQVIPLFEGKILK